MNRFLTSAAAAAMIFSATPAAAQTAQDRIGSILGSIFGGRIGTTNASLDAQWSAGRTPLADQRYQFENKVDTEVQAGRLSQTDAARIKSDYYQLVQTESRYRSDGQFSAQERSDLSSRYAGLTQVISDRGYSNGNTGYTYDGGSSVDVANGRADFEARVNAAVSSRRITRTQATQLKYDYAALIRTEQSYSRDGSLSESERNDLDARLDALDARIDGGYSTSTTLTSRARLDTILRSLPSSGLSSSAQAQLRVEQQDLMRLEAAYARLSVSADERAYLARRIGELEVRARVRSY